VVGGALLRDGRVLAALRSASMSQPNLWELPGGKVERGEDDAEALHRELTEELGIDVVVGDCLAQNTHTYERVVVTLVAYACQLRSGTPVAHEHAELRWVDAEELQALDWAPADVPLLPAVRARL